MQCRVGQVEPTSARQVQVAPVHSAGQTLEHLLVVLDRLAQPGTELLVLAPFGDLDGDGLANLLGDRDPIDLGDRFELGGLVIPSSEIDRLLSERARMEAGIDNVVDALIDGGAEY